MKICPKCSNPVEDGYSFCNKCGAPVGDVPSQQQNVYGSYSPAPAVNNMQAEEEKRCLETLYSRLGNERISFLVFGILNVISALFTFFIAIVFLATSHLIVNEGFYTDYDGSRMSRDASYVEEVEFSPADMNDFDDDFFDQYYYDYDDDYLSDSEIASGVFGIVFGIYFVIALFALGTAVFDFIQFGRINRMRSELHTDCSSAVKFCKSTAMIVVSALFALIPMIFHIINRVYVNDNKDTLEAIARRQRMERTNNQTYFN